MYDDSKKLFLVEAILKEDDDDVLKEIEIMLSKKTNKKTAAKNFSTFNNFISAAEAEEFGNTIEKGCEQINPDDWK